MCLIVWGISGVTVATPAPITAPVAGLAPTIEAPSKTVSRASTTSSTLYNEATEL